MSRWKAASIHLAISAAIAGGVLLLMLGIWYPPPYYSVSRADTLTLLIIGIDLVLGPLLTLIIFNTRKKPILLKLDLGIIAALQLAALVYGLHAIYDSRPVFLVAERDQITAVYAYAVDRTVTPESKIRDVPLWGPKLVGLNVPTDPSLRSQLIEQWMSGKGELRHRMSAYEPYAVVQRDLLANSKPATNLSGPLDQFGQPRESLRYVPIYCRSGTLLMILDGESGAALGAVTDSRPGL